MKFKIAIRNLKLHRRRNRVALLSIACGFAAINLFEGYIADAESLFDVNYSQRGMYGDLLIHRTGAFKNGLWDDGTQQISEPLQKQIDTMLTDSGEVDNTVRILKLWGMANNGSTSAVFSGIGYDVARGQKMREPLWVWNTLAGKPLDANDPEAVLIGKLFGRIVGCDVEKDINAMSMDGGYDPVDRPYHCHQPNLQLLMTNATGQMNATTVKVQGIVDAVYREFDLRFIAMPLEKAQTLAGTKNITFLSVRLKNHSHVASFISAIKDRFKNAGLDLEAVSWKDHPYGEMYVKSMKFLNVFRTFTLIVVLTIVTLSVLSTLVRLIQERTREIGTLRALGFRQSTLLSMFVLEIAILAVVGNLLGGVIALVITTALNSAGIFYKIGILTEKVPFHITLSPATLALSALGLMTLAMLAAVIAAHRAIQAKIPEALSHH